MKKVLIISFLLLFSFILIGCDEDDLNLTQNNKNETIDLVVVEIKGKIKFPGIYEVKKDSYLYELIELAGGLLADADRSKINMVQQITVPVSITIPSIDNSSTTIGLININSATIDELTTLNGIGEVIARRIIEYRETHGSFSSIEEIKNVQGIKESIFNQIKEQITVWWINW